MPTAPVSSRSAPTARPSVSASRSRRSSGAVLWETPRASSSLIRRRLFCSREGQGIRYGLALTPASGGGLVTVGAVLDKPRELPEVPLHPLQFRGHDRDVDHDQGEEDDVGAGDVLACLVEGKGGGRGEDQQAHL